MVSRGNLYRLQPLTGSLRLDQDLPIAARLLLCGTRDDSHDSSHNSHRTFLERLESGFRIQVLCPLRRQQVDYFGSIDSIFGDTCYHVGRYDGQDW